MKNKLFLILGIMAIIPILFLINTLNISNNDNVEMTYFNINMIIDSFEQANNIQHTFSVKEPTYTPHNYELKIIYYDKRTVYAFYGQIDNNSIPYDYDELFSSGFTILYSNSVSYDDWESVAQKKANTSSYKLSIDDNLSILYRNNTSFNNANEVFYQGESGKIMVISEVVEISELEKVIRSIIKQ